MSSKVFISTWISRPATAIATKETTAPIIQAAALSGFERSMARHLSGGARGGKRNSRRRCQRRAPRA